MGYKVDVVGMKFIDISLEISPELIVWPGDSKTRIESTKSIKMHGYNLSTLHLGAHAGTHIDAPSHFLEYGDGAEKISLDSLIGRAEVLDFSDAGRKKISSADLERVKLESKIVLLKTRNSELYSRKDFSPDFVYIDESAAEWLVGNNIKTIGIDYLSIAASGSGIPVHRLLLKNDVTVIEGLNLREVKEGLYHLVCLPLKIKGCDGAPARAVLIRNED